MVTIISLPTEILLLILSYTDDKENRFRLSGCCRGLYEMRPYTRILKIRVDSISLGLNLTAVLDLNRQGLSVPNRTIALHAFLSECLPILEGDAVRTMEKMITTKRLMFRSVDFEVKPEKREVARPMLKDVIHGLITFIAWESLSLRFGKDKDLGTIPFLPSLKRLYLHDYKLTRSLPPFLSVYVNTLQQLSLHACSIQDVSMLGYIPYLELKNCQELIDISSLNGNDHVVVEDCEGLLDFSQSFANSRKIEIKIGSGGNYRFDLSKWVRVNELILCENSLQSSTFDCNTKQLPKTVRKCHLGGAFINAVDFTVTSDHVLHEIKLSNIPASISLAGRGLENVTIIELKNTFAFAAKREQKE